LSPQKVSKKGLPAKQARKPLQLQIAFEAHSPSQVLTALRARLVRLCWSQYTIVMSPNACGCWQFLSAVSYA
jgi:hypothetical protein